MEWIKKILGFIRNQYYKVKVWFAYNFRLKPLITRMRGYVDKIINLRSDAFPMGKSLFVFPGEGDIIYFIVYKEADTIEVQGVFDEVLNKIPENYRILRKINFMDIIPHSA